MLSVLNSQKNCLHLHTYTINIWSQVAYQDILKILDPAKFCSSEQNFIDIYLKLPGLPTNGQLTEGDCIRVRICEGRFALLIREVCNMNYICISIINISVHFILSFLFLVLFS